HARARNDEGKGHEHTPAADPAGVPEPKHRALDLRRRDEESADEVGAAPTSGPALSRRRADLTRRESGARVRITPGCAEALSAVTMTGSAKDLRRLGCFVPGSGRRDTVACSHPLPRRSSWPAVAS